VRGVRTFSDIKGRGGEDLGVWVKVYARLSAGTSRTGEL